MRTVRCVCGGSITAPGTASSAPYVYAHSLTSEHAAWRSRRTVLEPPSVRRVPNDRALEREKYNRRPAPYIPSTGQHGVVTCPTCVRPVEDR